VLHGRCQFWAFAYPTGDPILISSLKLRESLEQVYKLYPNFDLPFVGSSGEPSL
jgi:hypothetical protein